MKQYIYADNAATTKLDEHALESMIPWLTEEYGNASQLYSFSRKPRKALYESREMIAKCINASPEEIFFTSGGTESDNWAIKGCVFLSDDQNEVITSTIEHHAILNTCKFVGKMGCNVKYISPDSKGVIKAESLYSEITNNTKLVSVMFSNNEIGTIQPIRKLAAIAHSKDIIFHTDAVQAVGHVNIDVKDLGVDMLSASAHKFNGPKGVGFLYIKNGTSINSYMNGGNQEQKMRSGTENIAGIVGMAVALEKNCVNIEKNTRHIASLEKRLLSKLDGLNYIRNGSENHVPGNISLSFREIDGETILHRMDLMGISISTGSACDSINTQISHVIEEIGVPKEFAKGTIRISLGRSNTVEEVDQIADSLNRIIKSY